MNNSRGAILALAAIGVAAMPGLWALQAWAALAIIAVLVGFLIFYPSLRSNCAWLGPVVTRFETDRREVWLTIDDGPDPEDTPQILALLAKYEARATFFLIGQRVAQYPELAAEILRQGHTLGNHTYHHPIATFWAATPGRMAREIDRCAEAIAAATGTETPLFRVPVGMANGFMAPVLRRRGLRLIGWSARGFDAVRGDLDSILRSLWRGVQPGAILLLHETTRLPDGRSIHPECIERVLQRLAEEGYSCVVPAPGDLR